MEVERLPRSRVTWVRVLRVKTKPLKMLVTYFCGKATYVFIDTT